MPSKSSLAITLSQLAHPPDPKEELEQYPTDSEIAAELLHTAKLHGDIEGKHVADLGCGAGTLGIGALLLGAERVTFLDIDEDALTVLQENLSEHDLTDSAEIIHGAVMPIDADTVVMNPPFGTKTPHHDRAFLDAATHSAPVIYSIHLASAQGFVRVHATERGYELTHAWKHEMPLKKTHEHHTKDLHRVGIVAVRLQRQGL